MAYNPETEGPKPFNAMTQLVELAGRKLYPVMETLSHDDLRNISGPKALKWYEEFLKELENLASLVEQEQISIPPDFDKEAFKGILVEARLADINNPEEIIGVNNKIKEFAAANWRNR